MSSALPSVPPPGSVDLGDLGRTEPMSRNHGYDRGTPVDRPYIEAFLKLHAAEIHGRVLEIQNAAYTRRFGGERVEHVDVLDVDRDNPDATLAADLSVPAELPLESYDCCICTQTLQFVYDLPSAIGGLHRLLRPGGVLLLSVPGISHLDPYHSGRWGEYWRFTPDSVSRLLGESFQGSELSVRTHGNVLAAIGYLAGLSAEELPPGALSVTDESYPLLITARCRKA